MTCVPSQWCSLHKRRDNKGNQNGIIEVSQLVLAYRGGSGENTCFNIWEAVINEDFEAWSGGDATIISKLPVHIIKAKEPNAKQKTSMSTFW